MPSITIPFPEGTRTVALRGNSVSIGRLPENTIQVRDRTISARHAELIWEGDHYRIHDSDSTNGVLINGRQTIDFHLREECRIQLGNLECTYRPESAATESDSEELMGRNEASALRQDNQRLRAAVGTLREQVETMRAARDGATAISDKMDQIAAELATLKQDGQRKREEMQRLRDNLAVIQRDRENLQRAYDILKAAEPVKSIPPPLVTPAGTPVAVAAPLSMPPKLPKPPTSLAVGQHGSNEQPGLSPQTPSTPVRRPASGVSPVPVRAALAAAPAPMGPKGTQKLVE